MTSALSDGDYRSLARFRHALRVFLHFSEEAARAAGLTPKQHQLLLAVRGIGHDPTIREVADSLQVRHHTVVELVQRAEAAGLVARVADERDRRHHRLRLTDTGEARLAELSRLHRDELRRFRTEMNEILQELD